MANELDFKKFRSWTKSTFIDFLNKEYKTYFVEKFGEDHWKQIRAKLAAYYSVLIDTTNDFKDLALVAMLILLESRFIILDKYVKFDRDDIEKLKRQNLDLQRVVSERESERYSERDIINLIQKSSNESEQHFNSKAELLKRDYKKDLEKNHERIINWFNDKLKPVFESLENSSALQFQFTELKKFIESEIFALKNNEEQNAKLINDYKIDLDRLAKLYREFFEAEKLPKSRLDGSQIRQQILDEMKANFDHWH